MNKVLSLFDVNPNNCTINIEEIEKNNVNESTVYKISRRYNVNRTQALMKYVSLSIIKINTINRFAIVNKYSNDDHTSNRLSEDVSRFMLLLRNRNKSENSLYAGITSIKKFLTFCLILDIDYKKCFKSDYKFPLNINQDIFFLLFNMFLKKNIPDIIMRENNVPISFRFCSTRIPSSKTIQLTYMYLMTFLISLKVYNDEEITMIKTNLSSRCIFPKTVQNANLNDEKYLSNQELRLIFSEIKKLKNDKFDNLELINFKKANFSLEDWRKEKKYLDLITIFMLMIQTGYRIGSILALTYEDIREGIVDDKTGELVYPLVAVNRVGNFMDSKVKNVFSPIQKEDYSLSAFKNSQKFNYSIFIPTELYDLINHYKYFVKKYYEYRISKCKTEKSKNVLIKNYQSLDADCILEHADSFQNKFLFCSDKFTKMKYYTVNEYFREIFEKVGIYVDKNKRHINLTHRFRHTKSKISTDLGLVTSFTDLKHILGNKTESGSVTYNHYDYTNNSILYWEKVTEILK